LKKSILNNAEMRIVFGLQVFILILFVYPANAQKGYIRNNISYPLGASVDGKLLLNNAVYRNLVAAEFNSITAENDMKMYRIHPEENRYDFTMGDSIVAFAKRNNMRVHGHTLVWFSGMPDWLKQFKGSNLKFEEQVKHHIQTVVSHYKGKIASWDVVNEYLAHESDSVRTCILQEKMGDDYLAKCFQWAHEADPDALLIYNEYGMEWSEKKLQGIIRIAMDFKKRKIPIDGLGVQFHLKIFNSNDTIVRVLRELSKTGLKIHISEFDMMVNVGENRKNVYTDSLKKVQQEKFVFVFNAYQKEVPDAQKYGITFWNVGDKDTWLRPTYKMIEWPLLFDDDYQRKAAYYAVLESLRSKK
jgi:endo-1,4-beta-xylanase